MRHVVAIALVLMTGLAAAHAESRSPAPSSDKALKPYAGKLVIAPDDPPRELDKLPAFLKINVAKDAKYEAWKGPPWTFYIVSWFAKPAGEVTLVIVDPKADAKSAPMLSVGHALLAKNRLLYATVTADRSTGFERGKTYVVKLMLGKKLLAKSELLLRD